MSVKIFTEEEKEIVINMFNENKTEAEIAQVLGRGINSIHSFINRQKRQGTIKRSVNSQVTQKIIEETVGTKQPKEKISMLSNGDLVFEGIIELLQGEPITPEIIMKAHNLDSAKWKVISFTTNAWQSQVKGGNKIALWQSKITVRENIEKQITFETIDNFFKNVDYKVKNPVMPFKYNEASEILEIDYTDTHTGLLSWRKETGSDFDLDIIENRFRECIADTIRRCKGKKFKKIVFATLGDILHIDNDRNETTAGTLQQVDGRISKIFDRAVKMLIDCIDALLTLKSPIEYVYVCGNHDRNTGYFLAKTVAMAYKDNKNIYFDITPNPLKAKLFGVNLIGFCHGDMPKKNLGEWLQKNHRKEYGLSRFAEVHCGHLHSESTKENCGVLIKHLPSICESSYWEYSSGYKSTRGTMCFIWNEETGLRETWYNYI